MPKIEPTAAPPAEPPDPLRPYKFHGLDLQGRGEQLHCDCPLCGKEGKFGVSARTGQWNCLVCGDRGGAYTFIRKLWEIARKETPRSALVQLAAQRKLLFPETLIAWGVRRSPLTSDWLVPGFAPDGRLVQLARWVPGPEGKRRLLPTPGLDPAEVGSTRRLGLFAAGMPDKRCETLFVAEGCWDAMALWEMLGQCKWGHGANGDGQAVLERTGSPDASLLANCCVVAVPGCNVFFESWARLGTGRRVILWYDSDHPRRTCKACKVTWSLVEHQACPRCKASEGLLVPPPGAGGARRATGVLARSEGPPGSLEWLVWGPEGCDPKRPHGWDVRDHLGQGTDLARRLPLLAELFAKVKPVPEGWAEGKRFGVQSASAQAMETLECDSWTKLVSGWRKALKWPVPPDDGLDRFLAACLATIISTRSVGTQLWLRGIAPPSTGKSVICEALAVNKERVLAKSTLRGLHSGFQSDKEGKEDNSLLAQLNGKTLVIKDGDTLLQSPNLDQILSEFRDVYDRSSRTYYRNRMSRDYDGLSITVILCGTGSLHKLDSSELGERFVTARIYDQVPPELEEEIGWRVACRAERELNMETTADPETQETPEMIQAKRLTGGYIGWLCTNAQRLFKEIRFSEEQLRSCQRLGQFAAFLRSRPSKTQEETVERELSPRLVGQMVRLAKCLAAVLNRPEVDDEVMRRVRSVAFDTARGRTLELARLLRRAGITGTSVGALCLQTGDGEDKTNALLRFMARIGICEAIQERINGAVARTKWRLTARLTTLWEEIDRA